jgi:diaminopimelate epimerase
MSQKIDFVKATACGNDFIIIDGSLVPAERQHEFTKQICHRHLGVGADGVEWLLSTPHADIEARLINSDGSDAEVSGNGTRCVAAWIAHEQKKEEVRVLTGAGVKTCTLTSISGVEYTFRSDMGEAKIDGEITVPLSRGEVRGIRLSVGNPQFIVFKGEFAPDWQKEAAELEGHRTFPHRTNVEFVKGVGEHEIEIRIYERGAGETMSSGTGSCASAIAAIYTGRVKSPVKVVSPGGPQTVTWDGTRITLDGPARILCRGEFFF